MYTTHELLRFATAGSVDDGKSTLVGRLLHDTKSVLADQLDAVERVSRDRGFEGADLALLTDGLRAEREQGITIDVAYRYFSTATRSFILADTPGHVQYTRNMVTGASTAEAALILVDVRHGVVEQTRRHAAVAALLGVRHVALAVNKMDLIDFVEGPYLAALADFGDVATALGITEFTPIPDSALRGDNVVDRSDRTPWYDGPTMLEYLERVPVGVNPASLPFRMPVQYVNRPRTPSHPDFRGYSGRIASGVVRVGDPVVVGPSGIQTEVTGLEVLGVPVIEAFAPQSITVILRDELDINRGEVIAAVDEPPSVVRDLLGTICVVDDRPVNTGDRVLLRTGTATVPAIVRGIRDRLDLTTLARAQAEDSLCLNELGTIELRLAQPVAVDPYSRLRNSGSFILIEPQDGSTLAGGMIEV
ncbi:MAG: GTP-binding protein [Candidatus Nanopelagicales bacterium]|nr:GTP-binding protein [Candidatus Nanopelagicales bacterium]